MSAAMLMPGDRGLPAAAAPPLGSGERPDAQEAVDGAREARSGSRASGRARAVPSLRIMAQSAEPVRLCPVSECGRAQGSDDPCCYACWLELPEPFRSAYWLRRSSSNPHHQAEAVEMGLQGIRRLSAEHLGAAHGVLVGADRMDADRLTRLGSLFSSFDELVTASGNWWPKLDCSVRYQANAVQRSINQMLADHYDREQTAKGDPRRTTRLGIPGL